MADLNEMFSALQKADAAGNVDDAKQIAAMIRQFQSQPAPSSQEQGPAYDPMTGLQITDIAPKVETPKPTLLTGTTMPQDTLRTGEYLPTTENKLQRIYDAATPAQREQLAATDARFKPIHEYYLAQDLINKVDRPDQFYKPMVPLDTFDTRVEARKNYLMGQGLAPDFAEATARRQALAGAGKTTPYGEVREAPEEYDIEQAYRLRPEMTGIEETGQILKRTGAKGAAAILKGAGGVNMFIGDALGLDTTDTKRTLDSINRYTQAIGVAPSKPVSIFENAVESTLQQLPALVGGAVTGSEIPVLASMFVQSFGQNYDDSKRMGMDTTDSALRSGLYASFEVLGEKFGLGDKLAGIRAIAKDVPTKDLSTFFAKSLVKELPGEQLTYAGQFAVDKGFGVNPEAGIKDFLQGSADTLVATVAQGALMLGGGAAAQKAVKAAGFAKPPEEIPEADLKAIKELLAQAQEIGEPLPQVPSETATKAVSEPPVATVAPEPQIPTADAQAEPAPVPPEIAQEEIGARDLKKMLAEVEGLAEDKITQTPAEIVQKGVQNPKSPEGQVLENLEVKQTATPQFKSWFGESKVTDDTGAPKVMYHGTTNFVGNEFKPTAKVNRSGNIDGYYFTSEPQDASTYSLGHQNKDLIEGAEVIPAYLSLKNPFVKGSKVTPEMLRVFKEEVIKNNPHLGERAEEYANDKAEIMKEYGDTGKKYAPGIFPNIDFPTDAKQRVLRAGGYDGFQDGGSHWVAFDSNQIKSAIGNIGTFKPESGNILENLERLSSTPSVYGEETTRSPSYRVMMRQLGKRLDKGNINAEQYATLSQNALEQTKKEREVKPRKRGINHILSRINRAVSNGELDPYAAELAEWFLRKNPALADDLGISISAPKEGDIGVSGRYIDIARVIKLFKGSGNPTTAVHEILHHLERMMPPEVQAAIRKAWFTSLSKAAKAAEKGSDQNLKDFYNGILQYHVENNKQAFEKSKELIKDGKVDYDAYQYINPSEFWAVNATRILDNQFNMQPGIIAKIKQWLRDFLEKAKDILGMPSDAPIVKALDSIIKSDGKFQTDQMISEGMGFENLKRTFKSKKTGQEVSEEKTPELYSWSMPEREDLILGIKKDDLMYQLLDKNIDTKQMQEAIVRQGNKLDDQFNAYQKETLYHGKVAAKTGDFLKGDVLPLVRDMNKMGITLEQLEEYLHMRHAEERNDKMNEINQGNAALLDRGSGILTKDAQEYFKKLPKEQAKKLEALAKQVDKIIEGTQDILVDSGAEEKGLIDTWRKTYKHYVPLFREDDDFVSPPGTQMGTGFRVTGATSKRATGSTKQVSNILGNIITQRERAIVRAEKMKVARALYAMAIKYPNANFWYAFNPDAVKSKKAAREELQSFGIKDVDAVMSLIDAPRTPYIDSQTGQVGYRISPITLQQHNAFPVRINGKDRYIFFNQNDPQAMRMAQTLSEIGTDKLDIITNNVGKLTHWLAAVNTQYNPVFGAVNLVRDVKGAMYNLSSTELAGHQKAVAKQVMPSMNTIRKVLHAERNGLPLPDTEDARLFIQFRDDGGQTGYRDVLMRKKEEEQLVEQELKKITDPALKKYGRQFVNALSDFNDTMENAVRFAAYKEGIKSKAEGGGGLSRDRAAYLAKELTVNFDRKGNLARRINAYFAFFNAAVRGSARIYETLFTKDANGKTVMSSAGKKIMAGGIGLGVMQAVMMAGYPDDDPPEFVRERNFIIPIPGTGKMLTIPYPLGYHVFPGLGRITTEFVFGKRSAGKAVTDALGMFLDAFNPLGGGSLGWQTVAPTVLKLPAQVAQNKDAFGRPIYREDRPSQPTPGYLRSRDNASMISKYIAEGLNYLSGGTKYQKGAISPTADEIDFYAGQVTGGVGRELAKTKDVISNLITGEETPAYRIPLIGRFYGDVESNAAKTQRFYNNIVEMSNHEQEIRGRQKNRENTSDYMKDHPEARLWQRANNVENQIAALKRERKDLKERGASDALIKQKNDQMLRLMEGFNKQVEAAKK